MYGISGGFVDFSLGWEVQHFVWVWQVFDVIVYEKLQVSKKEDALSVVFTYLLTQLSDCLFLRQKNTTLEKGD